MKANSIRVRFFVGDLVSHLEKHPGLHFGQPANRVLQGVHIKQPAVAGARKPYVFKLSSGTNRGFFHPAKRLEFGNQVIERGRTIRFHRCEVVGLHAGNSKSNAKGKQL